MVEAMENGAKTVCGGEFDEKKNEKTTNLSTNVEINKPGSYNSVY